jgi:hypothetical protein
MKLYLVHKIFEDTNKSLQLEEAKQKALLFLKSVEDVEELGGNYWIQISKEWDLQIRWEDDTSIEMKLWKTEKGVDGYFHTDLLQTPIKVYELKPHENLGFPVDEQKLKDFLEYFENVEYRNTGVHFISGGFTIAEYDGWNEEEDEDEQELYITLKWGVQSDVEDRVNTEQYHILIKDFNSATTNNQIYKSLDS